jgi:KDO2-lipid IV(A) lauroyltransferase
MPFWALYVISDVIYFIVYYIVGYRKDLVLKNLSLAFPEKNKGELRQIRKNFYHHFVDIFMEMIKTFTISEKELAKHYKFKNLSVIDDLAKKNKSIVMIGSHYANWEWAAQMSLFIKHKFVVTYTKVQNKMFDDKIKASRERFGGEMVLKADTIGKMATNTENNILSLYALLSDQSPQLRKTFYWNDFLGVRVPIHTGAEMLAKKYNLAVILVSVEKIKRGYYEASFELLTETPRDYPDYDITDIFLRKVEKQIYDKPDYYFWTHNRFKHQGKEKN